MANENFFDEFFVNTSDTPIKSFHGVLRNLLNLYFESQVHGRKTEWDEAFANLPELTTRHWQFNADLVKIGQRHELRASLEPSLRKFLPWRKGPFSFFDTKIDTEWRSDWKWSRIEKHITSLANRNVLDIGCGNGYYLFRMLGAGASLALGIDPTRLFLYQFQIAKRFLPTTPAYLLPLRCEHLPEFDLFDTVFSLGVLYHQRSPIDHLTELLSFLRPGGELVLETLVINGDKESVLVPPDRYAKMANVWFLPSTLALESWLQKTGFKHIRTVDITQTIIEEQRATSWMTFQSLADFLEPNNPDLTVEGLPAPKRAIVIAEK